MTKTRQGILPYERYKYAFVGNESELHADVRIVKAFNVTSPAFVVSTDPVHFRRVDDFTCTSARFYCISPGRVQSDVSIYADLMSLNTSTCEAFSSIETMNRMNCSLEASVEELKRKLQERKGNGRADDRTGQVPSTGRRGQGAHPRRGKSTQDEEDSEDMEKKRKKRKKMKPQDSEEESQHSDHDESDDNMFGK